MSWQTTQDIDLVSKFPRSQTDQASVWTSLIHGGWLDAVSAVLLRGHCLNACPRCATSVILSVPPHNVVTDLLIILPTPIKQSGSMMGSQLNRVLKCLLKTSQEFTVCGWIAVFYSWWLFTLLQYGCWKVESLTTFLTFRGYKRWVPQTLTSHSEDTDSSSASHRRLLGRPTSPSVITKVIHSQLAVMRLTSISLYAAPIRHLHLLFLTTSARWCDI